MADLRTEHVMGTAVRVQVRDARHDPQAVDAVFAWMAEVDARFSPWRPDSEVSRIGRGELSPAAAHPHVRAVLRRCEELRAATSGFFDARAAGALDPSGYVKGWAVDRAVDLLAAAGVRDCCVAAGGDLRVLGGPWRVGVQHPWRRAATAAVVVLRDAAVATSGAYERGSHVRVPGTGTGATGALSVTITGPRLGEADAYATAALAMGLHGPAWTAGLARHEALTILPGGRVLTTPGWDARRAA